MTKAQRMYNAMESAETYRKARGTVESTYMDGEITATATQDGVTLAVDGVQVPLQTAWMRLQRISTLHATQLWKAGAYGWGQYNRKTHGRTMYEVPEVIRENVDILGSGDDEQVKARLHWYLTHYPDIHKESRQ